MSKMSLTVFYHSELWNTSVHVLDL